MSTKFWTDFWSPILGCSPCSPGCARCWALAMVQRMIGAGILPSDFACQVTGMWTGKHALIERWLDKPLHWRKPRVVATGWLGDVWLADNALLDRMMPITTRPECAKHQFLMLTKRAELMEAKVRRGYSMTYSNHWFGATICNQPEADKQIPHLLHIPGKRWLCVEPLLGPLEFRPWMLSVYNNRDGMPMIHKFLPQAGDAGKCCCGEPEAYHGSPIDFVVVGQETGPGARPAKPEWIQSVIDQCHAAGVPVWTKALPPGVEACREAPEPIADILRREGMME